MCEGVFLFGMLRIGKLQAGGYFMERCDALFHVYETINKVVEATKAGWRGVRGRLASFLGVFPQCLPGAAGRGGQW